jgi:hypothetical protein
MLLIEKWRYVLLSTFDPTNKTKNKGKGEIQKKQEESLKDCSS